MITEFGKAIKFTEKSQNWCFKCWVYLLVDIYDEQRYYLTGVASATIQELNTKLYFPII